MIWSSSPEFVDDTTKRLDALNLLEETRLIEENLPEEHRPIPFYIIPPKAHTLGKLVVPHVTLNKAGKVARDSNVLYGVTQRPDAKHFTHKQAVIARLREVHVFAEDTALRAGIFTTGGRTEAEEEATLLVPESYRSGYITDRLVHLDALLNEIVQSGSLTRKQSDVAFAGIAQASQSLSRQLDTLAD